MTGLPYTGAIGRAHYSSKPAAPGIDPEHFSQDQDVDLFNPTYAPPPNQTGDAWLDREDPSQSGWPNLAQVPVSHVYNSPPQVRSGLPYAVAQTEMNDRMVEVHAAVNYVPDTDQLYKHAGQGIEIDNWVARGPQNAGVDPGAALEYLVAGQNSYDFTNQPNEVYTGDDANVGRYRLGRTLQRFGIYSNTLGKFGQDALLRAYTGLEPQTPVTKSQVFGTAPYTPNSTGTALTPVGPLAQDPSTFGLPSETSMTDFAITAEPTYGTNPDFSDDGGFF